jgi:hypothetical protein
MIVSDESNTSLLPLLVFKTFQLELITHDMGLTAVTLLVSDDYNFLYGVNPIFG